MFVSEIIPPAEAVLLGPCPANLHAERALSLPAASAHFGKTNLWFCIDDHGNDHNFPRWWAKVVDTLVGAALPTSLYLAPWMQHSMLLSEMLLLLAWKMLCSSQQGLDMMGEVVQCTNKENRPINTKLAYDYKAAEFYQFCNHFICSWIYMSNFCCWDFSYLLCYRIK